MLTKTHPCILKANTKGLVEGMLPFLGKDLPCSLTLSCKYQRTNRKQRPPISFNIQHLYSARILLILIRCNKNVPRFLSHFTLKLAKCFVNENHTIQFIEKWMVITVIKAIICYSFMYQDVNYTLLI
jgi:branched-subunit amino acid transport protein AzlD